MRRGFHTVAMSSREQFILLFELMEFENTPWNGCWLGAVKSLVICQVNREVNLHIICEMARVCTFKMATSGAEHGILDARQVRLTLVMK